MPSLEQRLLARVKRRPKFLAGLSRERARRVEGLPWEGPLVVDWTVACPSCGTPTGEVLARPDGEVVLGPLRWVCSADGSRRLLLDPRDVGYHVEVDRLEGGDGASTVRK